MAHSRGNFRSNLNRSPRRETSWGVGPGGTAATRFTASSVAFVGATITPLDFGITVVRTRGFLSAALIATAAAGEGFQGAFGIGFATAAAVAAGIASVPTPITEQGADSWLYWSAFSLHSGDEAHAVTEEWREVVDSKAMRKFPNDMTIYAAMEVVEIGAATMDVFFDSRILAKLS